MRFVDLTGEQSLANIVIENTDDSFKNYLGFENLEETFNDMINPDHRHSYWLVYKEETPIGVVYIYDYKSDYNKCSLAVGLFKEYRGLGYSKSTVLEFCEYLESTFNIVRIQVDIELTNQSSLSFLKKNYKELDFKFECTAENYWGRGVTCAIYSRCL